MKYPPFPFKHPFDQGDDQIHYLDINRPYNIINSGEYSIVSGPGAIKRPEQDDFWSAYCLIVGTAQELEKQIEKFKENYDFNKQFEEKLK